MIPFNKPYTTGKEFQYMAEAVANGRTAGNGDFTKRCQRWIEQSAQVPRALLTHSCTAALEMSAILARLEPGDEVIMPSYTFVSTANAFVLRGAVPVFVDVDPETLNIDHRKIEEAITPKTKALCVVHYAGVGCEMDPIIELARDRNLFLIEDAAQGVCASYKGRPLGSMSDVGAFSFHETKNVISGEGGALLINDAELAERAEIIWEKGTNRSAFFRGDVDKYTWVDIGSSYLPGELIAAFLWAQLEEADGLTQGRMRIWNRYYEGFADLEQRELLRRPIVPPDRTHNAHMFYGITRSGEERARLIQELRQAGFMAVFHYVPLHSAPAGRRYGRTAGTLTHTEDLSERLVRLPLWVGMDSEDIDTIIHTVVRVLEAGG